MAIFIALVLFVGIIIYTTSNSSSGKEDSETNNIYFLDKNNHSRDDLNDKDN